jgi:hypothetical protein
MSEEMGTGPGSPAAPSNQCKQDPNGGCVYAQALARQLRLNARLIVELHNLQDTALHHGRWAHE